MTTRRSVKRRGGVARLPGRLAHRLQDIAKKKIYQGRLGSLKKNRREKIYEQWIVDRVNAPTIPIMNTGQGIFYEADCL